MKKCTRALRSSTWKVHVTCILVAAHSSSLLWSPAVAQTAHETLVNDSLPLPELNVGQLQNAVKEIRARRASAAQGPGNPVQSASKPTAVPAIVTTAKAVPAVVAHSTSAWKGSDAQSPGLTNDSMWLDETLPPLPLRAPVSQATKSSADKQLTSLEPRLAEPSKQSAIIRAAGNYPLPTATAAAPAVAPSSQSINVAVQPVANSATTFTASTPSAASAIITATKAPVQLNATAIKNTTTVASLTPTTSVKAVNATSLPIFIDNDEETEQEQSIEYERLPTDPSGEKVKVGARFPIVITSEISSKTAKAGDPIQGRLKYDLKIGDRMIAVKGSVVRGHINYALKARTPMHSLVSPERWYKDSGCLGLAFDEIINQKNEHIPLVAEPARQSLVIKNKGEGRELGINNKGQVTGLWSTQLKYKAVRIGLNAALSPAGVFSFGAMPVALGVLGAANPSFAFMKPVGTNVRHRRIKGFFWGALSGVPGSWLIEDTTVKGQEAIIKPGDEFYAAMRQEFTGKPAPESEVATDADTQVKGEIVGRHGGKKKMHQ